MARGGGGQAQTGREGVKRKEGRGVRGKKNNGALCSPFSSILLISRVN